LAGGRHGALRPGAEQELQEGPGRVLVVRVLEHHYVFATDDRDRTGRPGWLKGVLEDDVCVLLGDAGVGPRSVLSGKVASSTESLPAPEACRVDGRRDQAAFVPVDQHLDGSDAGVAVEVAGGCGDGVVGYRSA